MINTMREYLTIGEVAKLLNTSTFNIRYYEKEGLIKPTQISESGYRLYDYDDVYLLNGIMILRDSDIPIKDIKKIMDNYSKQNYIETMKKTYEKIKKEIKRLETLQKEIKDSLDIVNKYENNDRIFTALHLPARRFIIIKSSDYQMDYSIKELYDIYDKNSIDMTRMYKSDLYYYLTDNQISLCILDDANKYNLESIVYEEGEYLSYSFTVIEDREIENKVGDLFDYIIKNNMDYEGEVLLIVGAKTSMLSDKGYIGELQIKIKAR